MFQNVRTHLMKLLFGRGKLRDKELYPFGDHSEGHISVYSRRICPFNFCARKKDPFMLLSLWLCCFPVIQCHTQPTLLFHWCNATLHEIFNPCSFLSIIDGSVWFSFILYQFVFNKNQVLNSSVAGPCFSDMS